MINIRMSSTALFSKFKIYTPFSLGVERKGGREGARSPREAQGPGRGRNTWGQMEPWEGLGSGDTDSDERPIRP